MMNPIAGSLKFGTYIWAFDLLFCVAHGGGTKINPAMPVYCLERRPMFDTLLSFRGVNYLVLPSRFDDRVFYTGNFLR